MAYVKCQDKPMVGAEYTSTWIRYSWPTPRSNEYTTPTEQTRLLLRILPPALGFGARDTTGSSGLGTITYLDLVLARKNHPPKMEPRARAGKNVGKMNFNYNERTS